MSEWKPISHVAKVRRGASPRPINDPNYFGGDVGWVRIVDVTRSSRFLRNTEQYLSKLGESRSVRVDKGDLIMSICGTIGKPIIIDMSACIHDGFVQLYDLKGAETEYLYYVLQFSEDSLIAKGQPGTQVNLNTDLVGRHVIFAPDVKEQCKIAKILFTVDNLIEKTQALIDKYQAIKQGMMHDLFTRGVEAQGRLRPSYEEAQHLYKESELGWIPKEWEVRSLADLGEIITGNTPSVADEENYGYAYMFVTPVDITTEICEVAETERRLSEKGMSLSRRIPAGSISTVCIGSTIGKIATVAKECATNQQINTLVPNEFEFSKLYYYLMSFYLVQQLKVAAGLQAVPIVNKSLFSKMIIPLPKGQEEKDLISQSIFGFDRYLEKERSQLDKLKNIKHGLMQDLLTGKVRVKVDGV